MSRAIFAFVLVLHGARYGSILVGSLLAVLAPKAPSYHSNSKSTSTSKQSAFASGNRVPLKGKKKKKIGTDTPLALFNRDEKKKERKKVNFPRVSKAHCIVPRHALSHNVASALHGSTCRVRGTCMRKLS